MPRLLMPFIFCGFPQLLSGLRVDSHDRSVAAAVITPRATIRLLPVRRADTSDDTELSDVGLVDLARRE
jgi:hypothetical protein